MTFHLTYQTQATLRESRAVLKAINAEALEDTEARGSAQVLSQLLPITDSIEFHFEEDNAPMEVLSLRDFWNDIADLADDYPAIWELWQELSVEAALIWWDKYDQRAGALSADPVLQMSDAEVASSNDPN